MRKLYRVIAVIFMLGFFISSCSKDKVPSNDSYFDSVSCTEADDSLNTYALKISTIFNTNCAVSGCHDAITQEHGRNFSSYSTAVSSFDQVLCAVHHESECSAMPRDRAKLSDSDIHNLTCWAKNNFPQ